MDKNKTIPTLSQTTVSGSALIAQYLGFKEDEKYPTLWIIKDQINQNGNNHFWEGNLKYNESWDWLMPIIEKIITEEKHKDGDDVIIRTFGMINGQGKFLVRFDRHSLFQEDNLIESTFNAVVDFLRNRV